MRATEKHDPDSHVLLKLATIKKVRESAHVGSSNNPSFDMEETLTLLDGFQIFYFGM